MDLLIFSLQVPPLIVANQNPEQQARDQIDKMQVASGWQVQFKKQINLAASVGVAVREYQTDVSPAHYILFVNKKPVGVIEAKREEESVRLTVHEGQTDCHGKVKRESINNTLRNFSPKRQTFDVKRCCKFQHKSDIKGLNYSLKFNILPVQLINTMSKPFYNTDLGALFLGSSIEMLEGELMKQLKGKVNLIITSPPFPLNTKKKYGNLQGDEYKEWFIKLGPLFEKLLAKNGSVVMEIGNAWEPDRPVQSLLHLECLLGLVNNSNLRLIQEFVCYNPSKLPSPAQWVTVNRIRTVDSYTHVWWMSKCDYPKADNTKVLRPYSKSMRALLKRGSFNSGKRPSQHTVSEEGFLKDNGGSISHNFFELENLDDKREVRLPFNTLSFANTASNDGYHRRCREEGITPHPARMNEGIADFFIRFLTDESDVVIDPFGGSNTTGAVAERLNRRWVSFEVNEEYANQSKLRFTQLSETI